MDTEDKTKSAPPDAAQEPSPPRAPASIDDALWRVTQVLADAALAAATAAVGAEAPAGLSVDGASLRSALSVDGASLRSALSVDGASLRCALPVQSLVAATGLARPAVRQAVQEGQARGVLAQEGGLVRLVPEVRTAADDAVAAAIAAVAAGLTRPPPAPPPAPTPAPAGAAPAAEPAPAGDRRPSRRRRGFDAPSGPASGAATGPGAGPDAPGTGPTPRGGPAAGQLRVHPAGYGFLVREDGEDDVFVSARHRGAALDGDRVAVVVWPGYKGPEGKVVEILSRGRARLTGVVQRDGQQWLLIPDDPRLGGRHAPVQLRDGAGGAGAGQCVLAEITRYPSYQEEPMLARVVRTLGAPEEPRTEVAKILLLGDIPEDFPEEVRRAGERAPREVTAEDCVDRVDLRDRPFLTIDPETARDFDDAVCIEDVPGSADLVRLWVAVADVSHYVRPGTALDREGQVRGCSVYLPDRAISMLPEQLSAGICSLNPGVDRLAMVVGLDVDREGRVQRERFTAAVIRSHGRLDYPGVAAALAGDFRGPLARYREHLPQLQRLRDVAARMRAQRLLRGALDFDLPEARVLLDEDDPTRVRDVVRSRSRPEVREAYRLVEDCMLAANEAVARFFRARELFTMYRIHEVPKAERLEDFAALALSHGLIFDPEAARAPKYLREFLSHLSGRPMEQALSYLLLRALKKARYDTEPVGHFGLAAPDYLHFTSPIRRYPDLVVHRLLKRRLREEGQPGGGRDMAGPGVPAPVRDEVQRLANEASLAERRAMEAEREVVDLYRSVLMRDQIGQEYDGVIVGITAFGIFVALEAPYVEGLIKTEALGSGYSFDPQTVRLWRPGGESFTLGDGVRVRVDNVSVTRRKIDFSLVRRIGPDSAQRSAAPSTGSAQRSAAPSTGSAQRPDKGQAPRPDKGQAPRPDKGQAPRPDKGQAPRPDKGQPQRPGKGQAPRPGKGSKKGAGKGSGKGSGKRGGWSWK